MVVVSYVDEYYSRREFVLEYRREIAVCVPHTTALQFSWQGRLAAALLRVGVTVLNRDSRVLFADALDSRSHRLEPSVTYRPGTTSPPVPSPRLGREGHAFDGRAGSSGRGRR